MLLKNVYREETNEQLRSYLLGRIRYYDSQFYKEEISLLVAQRKEINLDKYSLTYLLDNLNKDTANYLLDNFVKINENFSKILLEKIQQFGNKFAIKKLKELLDEELSVWKRKIIIFTLLEVGYADVFSELYSILDEYHPFDDPYYLSDIVRVLVEKDDRKKVFAVLYKIASDNYPDGRVEEEVKNCEIFYNWVKELRIELDDFFALRCYLIDQEEYKDNLFYDGIYYKKKLRGLAKKFSYNDFITLIKGNEKPNFVKDWMIGVFVKKFSREEVMPVLVEELGKKTQKEHYPAILLALQKLKAKDVLTKLVELLLKENDCQITEKIFETMNKIDKNESLNLIQSKFTTVKKSEQRRIVRYFSEYKKAKGLLKFIQTGEFDEAIKEEAFWSLERIKGNESLPKLIEEIENEKDFLRIDRTRIRALGKVIPVLIQKTREAMAYYESKYTSEEFYFGQISEDEARNEKRKFLSAIYGFIVLITQHDVENGLEFFIKADRLLDEDTEWIDDIFFTVLDAYDRDAVFEYLFSKLRKIKNKKDESEEIILRLMKILNEEKCSHIEQIIELVEEEILVTEDFVTILGGCENELVINFLLKSKKESEKKTKEKN